MSAVPHALVVVKGQVQLVQCTLYTGHWHPISEGHHVCPESWWRAAGKPVASPLAQLCPNCHYGVHVAIDGLIQNRDVSKLPRRWITMAHTAFTLATQNGLVPALTL